MDYGTTLYSVTEPIGNKPAEKFIETVLAGAAEYDNAIRKQRSTDGMSQKINQGIFPWKPPLGYLCTHTKKRGEKKNSPDPIDPKTFPIVQKGLKYYAQGYCSQANLVKLLDEWGLQAARGIKTTPQTVNLITGRYLKFYAAILINPWTNVEKVGLHTPMITKEELYKIQLIKSGKSLQGVKHEKYNPGFPLRRTIVCGFCNKLLTGSSPRGRGGKYSYYHCVNKSCSSYGKSISKQIIEKEFLDHLKLITPKGEFLLRFREVVTEVWKEKGSFFEDEAQKYQKRLNDLETKRKQIFSMREEGSYTKEQFFERKADIENEIMGINISMSEARIKGLDIEGALKYAETFIGSLDRQWFDLPPELRSRFQKLVFPEGIPYQKGIGFGTPKLGLIFELNRLSVAPGSPLVPYVISNWNNISEHLEKWLQLKKDLNNPKPDDNRIEEKYPQWYWGKAA
jgi:hypothetical protein